MKIDTSTVFYLMAYISAIIYLVVLGCCILLHPDKAVVTHGMQKAKRRLTRTMGVSMFIIAFESFLYLPPMLMGYPGKHNIYKVLFLMVLMLGLPMVYNMMMAVVQRKANTLKWSLALGLPFLILTVWLIIALPNPQDNTLIYVASSIAAASLVFLLAKYAGEYRLYLHRLQSEYSETSGHQILWSWICFGGFALQGILFVAYQLVWSPLLDVLYLVVSIPNVTFLCFCICRQRTLDLDVVMEPEERASHDDETLSDNQKEAAFYSDIEERLKTLCEDKLLFLDPELTRETLCLRLALNHTYLNLYFRKQGISYYQYINTLRIEYANHLMQENPDMPVSEVCTRSGFRSQPTFRKAFQEVMGCLPSEIKK